MVLGDTPFPDIHIVEDNAFLLPVQWIALDENQFGHGFLLLFALLGNLDIRAGLGEDMSFHMLYSIPVDYFALL